MTCAEQEKMVEATELREKFEAAMEDDFNTADAVSAIFELVKLANSTADASSTKAYVSCLLKRDRTAVRCFRHYHREKDREFLTARSRK